MGIVIGETSTDAAGDDSITVREVERQILENHGYEVAVAESPSAASSDARLSLHVSDTGNPEWASLTMNRVLLETMAQNSGEIGRAHV